MSQSEKAQYFRALKGAGVKFDRHYREYTTEELKVAYDQLPQAVREEQAGSQQPAPPAPAEHDLPPVYDQAPPAVGGMDPGGPVDPEAAAFFGFDVNPGIQVPVRAADPNEMAGQRQNSQPEDVPIRVDEHGRAWFQEEIRKPATPKPRGRRVLTYMETGVKEVSAKAGEYTETFEVAGDMPARPAEVKITLPSYQVGIYRDPRFPFKVHVYNGQEAFDLFDVQNYWGGAELVPQEVKRVYISNDLCYDIRTTVRAIEAEYRQLQLAGKIRD